jgi:hypothetical protein
MDKNDPKAKIKAIIAHFGPGDALSERVRRTLVRTLYTQPTSLAIGAIAGVSAAGVAAVISGNTALYVQHVD